jgi:hypothetical protein
MIVIYDHKTFTAVATGPQKYEILLPLPTILGKGLHKIKHKIIQHNVLI